MPKFGPVKWRVLVRCFQELGFDGPYPGGKHQRMVKLEGATLAMLFRPTGLVSLYVLIFLSACGNSDTIAVRSGLIAFSKSTTNDKAEVYVMKADGSGQTNLTKNPAWDGGPAWSPDGKRIAFTSDRDGTSGEVYVMNADGSGQTRLTKNSRNNASPTRNNGSPTWSPDGKRIAFLSLDFVAGHPNLQIYVMNADGSGQTALTKNRVPDGKWDGTWVEAPAWSPDGKRIAFSAFGYGGIVSHDIYVMNTDGSHQTRLTNNPTWDAEPAWSPDGKQIAFTSTRDGTSEVYVMNTNGLGLSSSARRLAAGTDPTWSPDGKQIAFISNYNSKVYVMNADGSRQTLLPFQERDGDDIVNSSLSWQPLPLRDDGV